MKTKKLPRVRQALIAELSKYRGPFAVYLSGGADSNSLLFALLEMGAKVACYTGALKGRQTRDLVKAQEVCKLFGVKHTTVWLPTKLPTLVREVKENFLLMDLKSKVEVEAFFVFRHLIEATKEPIIVTGLYAGIYFALNKSAMIHYRHRIDDYRKLMYKKATAPTSQTAKVNKYAQAQGKILLAPYVTPRMMKTFAGTTWDDVNTPQQKYAIRENFRDYFDQVKIGRAQDMHKGDSGISDMFQQLLTSEKYNPDGRFRSVVAIYNRMRAEALRKQSTRSIFRS